MSLFDRFIAALPERARNRFPDVRAALVLFHLVAVFLLAFPAPAGVMQRQAWKDPSVQGEFRIWTKQINRIGIQATTEEFEDFVWKMAVGFMGVRGDVLRPFRPYADYLGTRQDWRMFSAPHRFPTRLHIEIEENGEWRTLFVERSDEFTWRRDFFDHHRLRRVVFLQGWRQFRRRYDGFALFIAREVAAEFPNATSVRLSHFKFRSPTIAEARDGKWDIDGKMIDRRVHELESFR